MSSFDCGGVINRGDAVVTGRLAAVLGKTFTFRNFAALTDRSPRDERIVWMKVVKNGESSSALLPGQLVAWKTGLAGTTVVNPAATAGVQIAGVVDHLLPAAGAASGYDLLITVLGPTKLLLDANATSAEFDTLINSASVAGCCRTGTTSGAVIGRNEASGTTAAGAGALSTATSFWGFFAALGTGP